MTDPSADAFLSGQGIPVDLKDVESELSKLWGTTSLELGGHDVDTDPAAVTRIVLANLVVADWGDNSARVHNLLDTLLARYPCRAIVLRGTGGADQTIRAEVSAVCHLPAPGMPQVCGEKILLSCAANSLDLLPGAVRPLLETDLPLVLWWVGDPRRAAPLFRDLGDESSRILLDLPDSAAGLEALALGLDPALNPYTRDVAWFGITQWRELAAQFFDPPGAAAVLPEFATVRIEATWAQSTPVPRVSAWFAAWLAGQLGWKPLRAGASGGGPSAVFEGPTGNVTVEFHTRVASDVVVPHIVGFELATAAGSVFRASRKSAEGVMIEAHAPTHCTLPRTVHIAEWDEPRRLSAAFESARDDPPYRTALPLARWLLENVR
jgi:glucose-6-phosphate dehydrogenase assembly protein OpcA